MDEDQLKDELVKAKSAIDSWTRFSSDDRDELFSESVAAYWSNRVDPSRPVIRDVFRWLLKTAKIIRLVQQRKAARESVVSLEDPERVIDQRGCKGGDPSRDSLRRTIRLDDSTGWRRLPTEHRRLLVRVIGENSSVADAARELGMKRSTAKSWIERDKLHLMTDVTLRRFAGLSANHLQGDAL